MILFSRQKWFAGIGYLNQPQAQCGCCTVLMDGRPQRACLTLAADCEGSAVTTLEGVPRGEAFTRLQRAFSEAGAVQCGFCTAGMLLAAHALLQADRRPSIDDVRAGLSGNLCRCTGYRKIVDAVRRAAIEAAS